MLNYASNVCEACDLVIGPGHPKTWQADGTCNRFKVSHSNGTIDNHAIVQNAKWSKFRKIINIETWTNDMYSIRTRNAVTYCDSLALQKYQNTLVLRILFGVRTMPIRCPVILLRHIGLLAKLSKCLPIWCVRTVELLLRNRCFCVHMGDDTSSWRTQKNGLPQGCVPVIFQ